MRIVGMDPGRHGGFACLRDGQVEHVRPLPYDDAGLDTKELVRWLNHLRPDVVLVEEYLAFLSQGLMGTITGATNHGRILACCEILALQFRLVSPRQWQEAAGVPKDDRGPKPRALERVGQLFPNAPLIPEGCRVPHDGIVDAILIAYSGTVRAPETLTRRGKSSKDRACKNETTAAK